MTLCIDAKIDKQEVHGLLADFTQDQSQKQFQLRKELFDKISSIQHDIHTSISNFVQIGEMNRAMEEKVDIEMLQDIQTHKASVIEVDSLKKLIDRVAYEVENKPAFKDLDD
jgi:hypothetical protein